MKQNGYIKKVLESLIEMDTRMSTGSEIKAADYLKEELARMGVKGIVYEPVMGKGSLVAEIPGRQKASIVLHSHLDTADVFEGEWDVPPLRATRIGERLYGRGAIDSKGLTAVWMGVIKELLETGLNPDKTIVFAATAGEETGGETGTEWLLDNTEHFRNAELAIGEGGGIPIDAGTLYFTVQTGEREDIAMDDGARVLSEAEIASILERGVKAGYYDANTMAYVRGDIKTEKRHIPREYFYETLISERDGQTVIHKLPFADDEEIVIDPEQCPGTTRTGKHAGLKAVLAMMQGIVEEEAHGAKLLPYVSAGHSDNRHFRRKGINTIGFFPLDIGNGINGIHGRNEYITDKSIDLAGRILLGAIKQMAYAR